MRDGREEPQDRAARRRQLARERVRRFRARNAPGRDIRQYRVEFPTRVIDRLADLRLLSEADLVDDNATARALQRVVIGLTKNQ